MLALDYTNILLNLKDSLITNVTTDENFITIFVEQKRYLHTCPSCGQLTDRIHDYRQQTVKDIPMQGKSVRMVLRKRRYRCTSCQTRFPESNHFLARYQRMTNRLQQYLLSLFATMRSTTSIAQECRCSSSTAIRLFEKIRYPKPVLPAVIAIDEFRGNAGGHKFQCVISDPKNRKLLDILPNKNAEALYAYFTSFSWQERLAVEYVVMDLSTLFASVIKRCFPNAKIVADKFHVCRLANWAMETVRKEEQKKFGTHRRIYFKKMVVRANLNGPVAGIGNFQQHFLPFRECVEGYFALCDMKFTGNHASPLRVRVRCRVHSLVRLAVAALITEWGRARSQAWCRQER